MRVKYLFSFLGLLLVVVMTASIYSAAATTSASAAKATAPIKATAKQNVKKTSLKEANGWNTVEGKVVNASIDSNTLVLDSHGKDMKFSVPGRIDMLNLKKGERVKAQYIAEGKTLRLWQLKTN